ncbi:cytosolic endo-beta-N-acetylglucosaminidase isoform X3 [Sphaerodactylus townsendi]|uniref:cytosolic endo-beta-N-acetylglucosaminidase isoform X3 n=1 Tax=Sphaerodactylus townsendi TaxID=933632 RepID=UPI002027220C|nr:cytosolic endo-beta-N-acetylglucosaminidase isoform X3 [Sphaerodactylus townsendi]XP_048347400.1 cytosolic endo-beta-N-acetylglucosaminidase isoform X3 [Sphaerodactylus townsendi]
MESQRTSVLHRVVSFAPDPLPARQYDRHTTEPISFYLSGLEELLSWKSTSDDAFNISIEPLAKRKPLLDSNRPRTLVCHDMKGGYLEDRFIQGSEVNDPFVFYHWRYIDIFVYFSHHTVTIPPVVWTNAAHRNGVLMLGTFITEWTDGAKICESFLAGEEEAYRSVAEQLAAIAQFYQFDGWLVNIENTLSAAAARNMPHFLRHLTDRVHQAVPGGKVVWYDSVLRNGELSWQNELNDKNQVYFDACDGFFTNYNWKEEQLLQTRDMAGERRCDVYVGVDVFGRGDVVGGGFDSNKSLRLVRHHGLSVAIFAPGWVYEHLGATDFLHNENKFWGMLSEWLPTHSIDSLPFGTRFSLGMGKKHFNNGQENGTKPWYNLSAQEAQPLYTNHRVPTGGWLRTRCCLEDAWSGGSSLVLEGAIPPSAKHVTARLFSFQMPAPRRLYLVLIYKCEGPSQAVTVAPELTTQESHTCYNLDLSARSAEPTRHKPSRLLTPPPHLAQLMRGCGQQGDPGWQGRCYELELQNCILHELSVAVSRQHRGQDEVPFTYRLGEIWVLDAAHLRSSLPAATGGLMSSIEVAHVQWHRPSSEELSVSLTLHWTYPPSEAKCFRVHYRSGSCVQNPEPPLIQIGEAHATCYRMTGLRVPDVHSEASCHLEFLVEPVLHDGIRVAAAMWGKLLFVYSNPKLPSTGGTPNPR